MIAQNFKNSPSLKTLRKGIKKFLTRMVTRHMVVIMYTNAESPCCTPETNRIVYVSYTVIKKSQNHPI